MNILHLNAYDTGGAAKAAYRLHQNLIAQGINSEMLVLTKKTNNDRVVPLRKYNLIFKAQNMATNSLLKLRSDQRYFFQNQNNSLVKNIENISRKLSFKPDIIVAHWLSNFLTVEHLYQLSQDTAAPIIWYLLDMAPMTGGCHYAWDCKGYMNQCGQCPALYSQNNCDLSYRIWQSKYNLIQKMNITVVSATTWLNEQAKKATVFHERRIEKILLGVNPEIFKPIPKPVVRNNLELPHEKKIIFFAVQAKKIERKGIPYLIEALKYLSNQSEFQNNNILIITAGIVPESEFPEFSSLLGSKFQHKHLGFLSDDEQLAMAYQAADLFVCPSIEDSGPMMINESILCGTSVVSFEMGVALDLVHTGETGYRAKLKSSEDLANGIKYVLELSSDEAKQMSEKCRQLGLQLCHPVAQTESFKKLFDSILSKN